MLILHIRTVEAGTDILLQLYLKPDFDGFLKALPVPVNYYDN